MDARSAYSRFRGIAYRECVGRPFSTVFPELLGSDLMVALNRFDARKADRWQTNGPSTNLPEDRSSEEHPTGDRQFVETMWPGRAARLSLDIHATASGTLVWFRDVLRQIAREPHARHAALDLAETSSGIGVFDIDLRSQTVRGTEQFFRIMGLSPTNEPVPTGVMRDLRFPEEQERLVEGFKQAVANGEDIFESEYRESAGRTARCAGFSGRGRVLRDAAGVPIRFSGIDIDGKQMSRDAGRCRGPEICRLIADHDTARGIQFPGPDEIQQHPRLGFAPVAVRP